MGLREERFKGIVDLMKRRVEPTFRTLATAGFELSHSYLQLHSKGLCYRDISFGNVFFDPASGEVRICDNDNVDVDGQPGIIAGTPKFMAPELVRGESAPSVHTDLYSLGVLLFYMFFIHHPLDGAQEAAVKIADGPAIHKIYGTHPSFVFDPHNERNRPVPGYQDNVVVFWKVYPKFLRDLFTQAFTSGLQDPSNGRVRESTWRQAFVRLRDLLIKCPDCGAEVFYDRPLGSDERQSCWSCYKKIGATYLLIIGSNVIVLEHGTKLFPHHVDQNRLYDFTAPVGEVAQHPHNPQIWGLRNLSAISWRVTLADGTSVDVPHGRSVVLRPKTLISFARCTGEVQFS